MITGDRFIKCGFWCQFILLAIIDWGSVSAFLTQEVPWYHYVGFTIVNGILLTMTWILWGWMRDKRGIPLDSSGVPLVPTVEDEP